MTTDSDQLERRVAEIERELAELRSAVLQRDRVPWWRRILGEFEGDEEYAEIVRLGHELRRADRPE
jgi:hypothetical protein